MAKTPDIDCIIVGYNDVDFRAYASAQKKMESFSGTYRDIKHNSVRLNGKRLTYAELMNHGIRLATNHNPNFNIYEVTGLGTTYLTSYLRQRDYSVEMIGFFNFEERKLADLLRLSPMAVAITTTYYVDPSPILDIVRLVRDYSPATRIIVGGPYLYNVSTLYTSSGAPDLRAQDYILRSIGADIYVCDSQGEQTLSLLLKELRRGDFGDISELPNLIYTTDNKTFVRTRRQQENNDLDGDAVDWSVFRDDENIFSQPVFFRTARSCPFSCSFCNFPAVGGAHIVSELDVLEKQFRYLHQKGVKYINFIDDTFNVPLPRFKNLLRMMIRNKFDFNWISFFRCSNADDVTFDMMRESGCQEVFLGIESGDQEILNNMRKFAKIDKYKDSIRKLNERGITTYASFIVGFPGETRDTVMKTIDFLEDTSPGLYNLQMYYHDVRTPIHKESDKYGIQGAGYCWKHKTMTWQEAADWTDYGFSAVTSSIPTTIYGFSIWILPYLKSKGLSSDQIMRFLRIARGMLVRSFDDVDGVFPEQEAELGALFQDYSVTNGPLKAPEPPPVPHRSLDFSEPSAYL